MTCTTNITTLKADDFSGLSSLESVLERNQLPPFQRTYLMDSPWLDLGPNRTQWTYLMDDRTDNARPEPFTTLPVDIFDGLTALTTLGLHYQLTLPAGIFDKLSSLNLGLYENQLTVLPEGLFSGLSSLTSLNLSRNAVDPLPLTVSLEKVAEGQFKAIAPTGAPFDIVLPLSVTNGTIDGGATTITIPAGSVESQPLTVVRTPGTTAAVTMDIGTLPRPPTNHSGYTLVKSADLPLDIFSLLAGGTTYNVGDAHSPRDFRLPALQLHLEE